RRDARVVQRSADQGGDPEARGGGRAGGLRVLAAAGRGGVRVPVQRGPGLQGCRIERGEQLGTVPRRGVVPPLDVTPTGGPGIHYTVNGGVAVVSFANPPVNGLSHAVRSGLAAALERAQDDHAARA